jgi:hypothetical protein
MKNSIGKPYEGKLHVRFDVGGSDSQKNYLYLCVNNKGLSGSTLPGKKQLTEVAVGKEIKRAMA